MYPSTMYPSTLEAQTAWMEEFCKANECEYQQLGIPIIDLNVPILSSE